MINIIKNHIKTKPFIYDCLNAMRPIEGDTAIWLDRFSKENHKTVNFVQVGANDGLRWDPLRRFILRDDWAGVLIEPILPVYELLKKNYSYVKRDNLFFENCAIFNDKSIDTIDFWSYSDAFLKNLSVEDRLYYLRKSSLSKKHVENSLKNYDALDKKIECYKTPCMRLSAIIEHYFPNNNIDLIFIDAEGHDDEVIRTIDFEKCIPKAIFYEYHNLGGRNAEIKDYLVSKGYIINQLKGDVVAEIKN